MLEQDNYFAVTIKLNVCYRQTHCIDGQEKVQYIKDTDNEFAQFQTPRKKLQSIGISLASLHAFMKTLKSDILETYKVDYLKIQSLISMIKMIWNIK